MSIVIGVKDGVNYLGDADAQIAPDDTLSISLANVRELLARRLDPVRLGRLDQIETTGGFATVDGFEKAGFVLRFDKRSLELVITLAVSDRAVQNIGLAELDRAIVGDFATPENFSAYVNIRGSLDYLHAGPDRGFADPFFVFEGAMRIAPFVIEAEGAYSGFDNRFQRTGTRIVFDDTRRLLRWTAGDLLVQNRGFQGVLDVAGVGMSRTYALLEPSRNVAPRGGRTFSVSRDATVEAYVNGRPVRTLRLQPGTYNISDFPFAQGGNDVELVIVDDTGLRETISFSTFIERNQLAPGLSEFDVNIGVLTRVDRGLSYTGDIAASGFYRRGITENLTLGGNFQYARKSYLVGVEGVLGTPIGTIGGDVAISHLPSVGKGLGANFSLERVIQTQNGSSSLLAAFEYRSRYFGSVGQLGADNPYDYNVSVSYNMSFGRRSFAGIQARYAHGRGSIIDERSARITYGHRLSNATNLTFDAEWSKGARGEDKIFRISLVQRFGQRSSARAEYDSRDERVRLGVQSSGGYGIGAWSAGGNAEISGRSVGLNAAASYVANRADLALAHTAIYSPDRKRITDQRTSLRFASSVAFAGDTLAVGRPISDSFAIVRPFKGGTGLRIEVDPAQNSAQARSGVMGPALYGQLTSYSPRTLTYDVPNAPAGLDTGTGSLRALAPYRSGYVVDVGSDYNIMVIGALRDSAGPLSLRSGFAIEDGGQGRRIELFTNRQGRFAVSGLKAGRWRVDMSGTPPMTFDLVIPETAEGIVRIGDLTPTDKR